MELSAIYQPIRQDMRQVEKSLRSLSHVDFPWLSELLAYCVADGGKQIRPALTLLSGQFYDYDFDRLLPMAMAVELLHTATLVHDDAIDDSAVRRGRPTVNCLWGRDKAVLLGDYLFAKAGEFTATTRDLRVIMLFTRTLETISTGELNQIYYAYNPEQTRQNYVQRIAGKTASLFCLATESGGVLSGAPEAAVQVLNGYGYNLGIAFQIVDDILDFVGTEAELGKPVGSDLTQGTLTLPAMLLLERYPGDNPVRELFRHADLPPAEKQPHIERAIAMVGGSGIIEECYRVAADYAARACADFDRLPDKAACQTLRELAGFVVARKR